MSKYQHKGDSEKVEIPQQSSDIYQPKDTQVIEQKLPQNYEEQSTSATGQDIVHDEVKKERMYEQLVQSSLGPTASPETVAKQYAYAKKEEAQQYLQSHSIDDFPQEIAEQLKLLSLTSYFSLNEMILLHREFTKYTNGQLVMTKDQFLEHMTPFNGNEVLAKSLMNAIDRNGDESIQFVEFIQAVSIMCRGTKLERLRFTFQICDFNGDSMVSREEVRKTIKTIAKIFSKIGFNKDDRFGDPVQVVNSVFSGGLSSHGSYIHYKDELNLPEFIERSSQEVDLSHCFGMFDYFFTIFLLPWEQIDVNESNILKGNITKIKTKTFLNLNIVHHRVFSLKDGFLIIYKQKKFKKEKKKPSRVIYLPGSTAKVVENLKKSKISKKYHSHFGFRLTAGNYSRFFLMESQEKAQQWVNAIRFHSRYGYRFQAFSKVREHIQSEWFINGAEYYGRLAQCLREAKYEIFIAGWWVWPYVCLERHADNEEKQLKSRLDKILTERAEQGVKIRILVWNETNIGVQLGSGHAKRWLESCHPNIEVIRHPKIYPLSWSHHQKSVVIDQRVAFIGGVDICFMRFETHRFQILDVSGKTFLGKDYGNLMTACTRTGDPHKDQLDRLTFPRMPWHDVHVKLEGLSARDAGHNFIQRWNHAVVETGSKADLLVPKYYENKEETHEYQSNKVKNLIGDFKRGIGHLSYGAEKSSHKNNRGIDNPKVRKMAQAQAKLYNSGQGFHIDQDPQTSEDISDTEDEKDDELDESTDLRIHNENQTTTTTTSSSSTPKERYHLFNNVSNDCCVQIVRSGCEWSIGCETEDSCYKAYLHFIRLSKHFIYIQNLFFISSCGAKIPKNRIALAILNRIRKAIKLNEDFTVSVLVSINPSGDINEAANRMVIAWTNKTMFDGPDSILGILSAEYPNVDLSKYIGFYSLRQWEISNGKIFTEQIYVHSKVLIVDDKVAVIGSCNINDRSMLGYRDSEMACVVQDQDFIPSTMGGKPVQVSKFAHTLRVNLWRLHLGLKDNDIPNIIDPVVAYKDYWLATANSNTKIYKEVFGDAIPENQSRYDIPQLKFIPATDEKTSQVNKLRGVLILYPRDMYNETNLLTQKVNVLSPEYYVDVSVFT
ncbi:phospholipase D1 [Tieghemostelium lacteum]|uniref:phospholipase D n=1 Tax=Tieghemostelium lacteum TaxID=361077 RepID=A0A151ZG66_TIELA|nr:phospholipase D1 [Tieghemostelium lacteum]|eukprot:KYQ92917.1 phospholipase D1 [Tieghemostelium lacteum]